MQYNDFSINRLHAMTLFLFRICIVFKQNIHSTLSKLQDFSKIPPANAVVEGRQIRLFLYPPQNARPPIETNIRIKHNVASNYKKKILGFLVAPCLRHSIIAHVQIRSILFIPWRSTFLPRAERIADGNPPNAISKADAPPIEKERRHLKGLHTSP
ncbi:hypothetical protein GGI43DRAFT_288374 [Trichoderma evansii]